MRAIQYCSNCGRENEINSKFCKYCGGFLPIQKPQSSEKKSSEKNCISLFEYLKENSGYIVIAGVFAALSVYLTQFNSANKSLSWVINGTISSSNLQFLNNSPTVNPSNISSSINFSANISSYLVSPQNFLGVNTTFLNIPQDQVLSPAIAASYSIFFLIAAKIWFDIQMIDTTSNYGFIASFSKSSIKWFFLIFYGYLIIFLGLYVIREYFSAIFAYAIVIILIGSVYLTVSIYLHLRKNSGQFFVLDSLIYGLSLIEYLVISIILLETGIFSGTVESGIIGSIIILSLPGCFLGILLGFWPSIKILFGWVLEWFTNKSKMIRS
jgi:hypothetical protein